MLYEKVRIVIAQQSMAEKVDYNFDFDPAVLGPIVIVSIRPHILFVEFVTARISLCSTNRDSTDLDEMSNVNSHKWFINLSPTDKSIKVITTRLCPSKSIYYGGTQHTYVIYSAVI